MNIFQFHFFEIATPARFDLRSIRLCMLYRLLFTLRRRNRLPKIYRLCRLGKGYWHCAWLSHPKKLPIYGPVSLDWHVGLLWNREVDWHHRVVVLYVDRLMLRISRRLVNVIGIPICMRRNHVCK
jgi:hypothetical protein